jgi:predicted helicase
VYSVLHSHNYRTRYAGALRIEFPKIPIDCSEDLASRLFNLGGELVSLHLLESPILDKSIAIYRGSGGPAVEKVSYSCETVWLDKSQTCGFQGVPEAIWNFHIGGYQVCEKWLKDRKGHTLSKEDIDHYQRIIVALSETIRIMAEIDKVIEEHGGWPGAFVTRVAESGPKASS